MNPLLFPTELQVYDLADKCAELAGELPLADMPRLRDFCDDLTGVVKISLKFMRDAENYAIIRGSLHTQVLLTCQRCLGPLTLPIDSHFVLSPVANEEAASALPECYEAWVTPTGSVNSLTMVEDELILDLPIVPMHPPELCQVSLEDSGAFPGDEQETVTSAWHEALSKLK